MYNSTRWEDRYGAINGSILLIQKFYDTMLPRMEPVLHFLSKFPAGSKNSLPGETRLLLYLALAMAEITAVVEMYREPSVPNGFEPECFIGGHPSFKD